MSKSNGNGAQIARWRRDPAAFITEVCRNPKNGKPFKLFEAELLFLKLAFTQLPDGSLPFEDILWSCIKKSGKSTFGALCLLYVVICLGGNYAEAYVLSNDLDQARDRIFTSAARIVESSPMLKAKVQKNTIEFSNGSFIQALAADYRGAAGSEPVMVIADEVWGFTTEASQRLYAECCPTPTRTPSIRMVTSYAGYTGESVLLERLVNRGLTGEVIGKDLYAQPGLIAFISHERIAPWQSEAWFERQRRSMRPTDFQRQMLNQFAAGESEFVTLEQWDGCIDFGAHPIFSDPDLPVCVGLDASTKHDSTAIVAVAWDEDAKRVNLVWHKIIVPSVANPIDFENQIESELLALNDRFDVRSVKFDPWQLVSTSQRLRNAGVRMEECSQTPPNQTEWTNNLFELVRSRGLAVYADSEIRLAISRAVVVESPRGKRIAKEKQSHQIDVVVALAMACLGAVQEGQRGDPGILQWIKQEVEQRQAEEKARFEGRPPTPAQIVAEDSEDYDAAGSELVQLYENTRRALEGKGPEVSPSGEPWPRRRGW